MSNRARFLSNKFLSKNLLLGKIGVSIDKGAYTSFFFERP